MINNRRKYGGICLTFKNRSFWEKDFSDNDRINFMDLLAKKFTGREWPDMTEGPIVAENFKNAFYFNARKEGYML